MHKESFSLNSDDIPSETSAFPRSEISSLMSTIIVSQTQKQSHSSQKVNWFPCEGLLLFNLCSLGQALMMQTTDRLGNHVAHPNKILLCR